MKRPIFAIIACLGLLAAAATLACTDPVDPVAIGELCVPATTDCPDTVDLERPGTGRNKLEFTLHNVGDDHESAAPVLQVTTDQDIDLPDERETTEQGDLVLFERDFPIAADETITEVLGSFELTVASRLRLHLDCGDAECDHRLEYLYFAESVECTDDGVCARGEFCESAYGRCAECADDAGCATEQTCDRTTGMCYPGDATGCQSAPSGGPPSPPVPVVLLAIAGILVGLRWAHRRRQRWAPLAIAGVMTSSIALVPGQVQASVGATMNAGGGARVLTGEAGQLTRTGWGFTVSQQVRWRSVGLNFELSNHSLAFSEDAAPDGERLSGYRVGAGPRLFITLPILLPMLTADRPFQAVFGVDYTRWAVAENRMARITGLDLAYHAITPGAGIAWRWGGIGVSTQINYSHIFGWPGGALSIDLMVGVGP